MAMILRPLLTSMVGVAMSSMALAADDGSKTTAEVVVRADREPEATQITEQAQKLIDVPGALGDPVAAVFSLPGVVYSGGEFSAPAVRGSAPQDNLYIVDFLPAGYVFHAFTNSVFSENIIQDFELYPAAFGPQYSDATGAVFDISLREPANTPLRSVIDVSMLRSGVFLEGAVTENSAAYLSVRKSLIHLFMSDEGDNEEGVRFQKAPRDDDYQFKYAWHFATDNTLTLAANGASDLAAAGFESRSDFAQENPDFAGDARVRDRFRNQSLIWDGRGPADGHFRVGVGRIHQDAVTRWARTISSTSPRRGHWRKCSTTSHSAPHTRFASPAK